MTRNAPVIQPYCAVEMCRLCMTVGAATLNELRAR
jgi:hypothetical protein